MCIMYGIHDFPTLRVVGSNLTVIPSYILIVKNWVKMYTLQPLNKGTPKSSQTLQRATLSKRAKISVLELGCSLEVHSYFQASGDSLFSLPVMMAFPFGVISTAWQVKLVTVSLSNSLPVSACHTLTSLRLLVANNSEESLNYMDEE